MKKILLLLAFIICAVVLQAQVDNVQREAALQLVRSNNTALGMSAKDVSDVIVSATYKVANTDVTMVYLQQSYLGIPVYNQIQVLAFKNGKLVSNAGDRLTSMEKLTRGSNEIPSVSAVQAVRSAFAERNIIENEFPVPISNSADGHRFEFGRLGVAAENIKTELIWIPGHDNVVSLAWQVQLAPQSTSDYWLIRIDARSGAYIDKTNLTVTCNWDDKKHSIESHLNESHFKNGFNGLVIEKRTEKDWRYSPFVVSDANYTVIKYPAESPQHTGGTPSVDNKPWLRTPGNATTLGWHDNGTVINDSTKGNNVWAQEDRDNNNSTFGKTTISTTSQPTLTFADLYNFTLEPTEASLTNQKAAITNLFYWNNLMHDISYAYGFDEVSGNFQNNNQSRGGLGNDYVIADAQDAGGSNNANMSTPVDGTSPRMQMYLFSYTSPNRDGDLDNGVINHEYTHGISNRLTGGPGNTSCLSNAEEGGEGWSDYFALMTTTNWATATVNDGPLSRPIGTYVLGQPVTGAGIRSYPYSTNLAIDPLTYSFVQSSGGEVHSIGEVWCVALWEMTWEIIKQDNTINTNFFVPGPVASMVGNSAALKLVIEGMRLQPCSPGFIDARNAILKADTLFFNSRYSCSIWKAFAKRGMGRNASQGSSNSTNDQVVDFTLDASSLVLNTNAAAIAEDQNIVYTNKVSSGTCNPVTNFTLTDTLPANVTYVSGGSYNTANRVVSFNPVTVAQGSTQSYVFTVSINAGTYFPPVTIIDEPVAGATIPATWTETSTTSTHWAVSSAQSHTSPNSFFSPNIGSVSDQILATTNSFSLGSTPPVLTFWHYYNTEPGYDGGVVEISTNGGSSWQDIGAANFTSGGYNGTLSSAGGTTNPLGGRLAFNGNSSGFIKSTVNLTSYANQANVKIRFRFGSDEIVSATGWYIDDIQIKNTAVVNMRTTLFDASNNRISQADTVTAVLQSSQCSVSAPSIGNITQPTCAITTGSVVLNNLPASGTWTINPGAVTGTGTTTTISGLAPGTYNFTVTIAGCISVPSANVVINSATPSAPIIGAITQPTCAVSTGSVALNGLPATGTWIINPGAVTGSGTTTTIAGLATGTYSFTVTNANGCTSTPSANVVIIVAPVIPSADAPANQSVCNNTVTTPINFTGPVVGTVFNWTNNNTSVGLAASGTGNIASFTAINNSNAPVTATITVTPSSRSFAYISNYSSNTVSVINISTNTVVATVAVGISPFGVSVSPDGSKVYVTNYGSNAVSVINTATNTVLATVAVGSNPIGISVSPDGSKVYAGNNGSNTVSVISTATNTVVATIAVGTSPFGVSVSPDGSRLYVANYSSNTVSVINTATNSVVANASVGSNPWGISVSPDSSRVYVTNLSSNNVSVINTATNSIVATVSVGLTPLGISVNLDGSRVYVANYGSNTVSVISTVTNSIVATVSVGSSPRGVSVSPDGSRLYVANSGSNTVSIINTATNTVVSTVSVGSSPVALGNFISGTGTLCTGSSKTFTISVNPAAAINAVANQTICNNTATNAVIFSGGSTGTVYNWTNNNASIGLPANGTGNIASFTAMNTTNVPVTATITVIAAYDGGTTCASAAKNFTITVNPTATVNNIPDQAVCNNSATSPVIVTGPVTGTVFNWTNNKTSIGLPASGTGNIASFTATNTTNTPVTATITVTPFSGGFAYISNYYSNTVSVINMATNTEVATVAVGTNPYGVSVSPYGSKVYVTNSGSNTVSVINMATNAVVATVAVGTNPIGISVSPDGSKVYAGNTGSNTVSVISTATNTVVATIAVGINPKGISVSPDGSRVYVANLNSNSVSVINAVTNSIVATISVGSGPFGVSVSPDGSSVYVANYYSNTVSVINAVTNSVVVPVSVGSGPYGISVSPDGSSVYVANSGSNTVSVINTATNTVIASVSVGSNPIGVSVNPDASKVYVANSASTTVSVINTATNTVVSTVSVGSSPVALGNFTSGTGCTGSSKTFSIVVNPAVIINAVANQTVCNNTATNAVIFSGGSAGTVYNWTNNTTSIGLPASGTGNIASFTAMNTTNVPVTATITVIASYDGGTSCASVSKTFTITVNPTATVNSIPDQTVCNSTATTPINFTGPVAGTVFNWTNNNTSVGLAASGTGSIASFTAINNSNAPVTATVTVTPSSGVFAYISNFYSNTVSVINTVTNTVAATIPVGTYPYGVSVSPDGSRVYVTNSGSNTVSVINTATNTVVATVAVGSNPYGVSVNPDGSKVYVANNYSNTVSVISTATNTVVAIIAVGSNPYGVSVSPDGSRLYVANYNSNTVSVISTTTNTVVATVSVGSTPYGISVSPDGSRVYVANYNSNTISVINTATNTVVATIAVGTYPFGISVSPDGSRVYVANYNSNTVSVINTASNSVVASVPVGTYPEGVSASPDGSRLYVANYGSNTVSVLNTATNTVVSTVSVGSGPAALGNFISGNGCTGLSKTFIIAVNPIPSAPTVTASGSTTFCAGGSVTLTSNAATGNQWYLNGNQIGGATSSAYNAIASGLYTVIVTTGGCSSPASSGTTVTVNSAPAPATPVITGNTSFCTGSNTTLSTTAVPGANYCWQNTATAPTWSNVGNVGFSAGLASYQSLAFNGNIPYVAYEDAINGQKTTVMKFDGTNWINVGSVGFSAGPAIFQNLAFNGNTPYVSYQDGVNGQKATVMKFDGTNWVNVGSAGFSSVAAYNVSLAFGGNTPYVAYQEGNNGSRATVMKFDGTNWVNVGSARFSAGVANYPSLAFNGNTPYVAYQDGGNSYKTTVMKFDGTNWVTVGNAGFSAGEANYQRLAFNGNTPYVAYLDYAYGSKITVMRFDGTNWVNLGISGFSEEGAIYPSLALNNNTPYVAYTNYNVPSAPKITVMKFDGTNWGTLGNTSFSAGFTDFQSLAFNDNTPYVVYEDGANGNKATVIKYAACESNTNSLTVSTAATYTLTVTNSSGCSATSAPVAVTVNPVPTVNSVANQTLSGGQPTTAISFTGIAGTVYNWTNNTTAIGLAASGTGNIASFTAQNTTNSPLVATITVTPAYTNGGATCTGSPITFTITVNPAVSTAPTANAGLSQIIQLPTSQTTLTGTGTSGNGSTLSYGWTRVSGPNNSPDLTIVSPTSATTNITGLIQGTYVFRLTVTQSDNQTATSDVTVTVNPVVVSNGKTIPGKIEAEAWDTKSGYQYSIPTTDVGGGLKMVGISNGSWLDYDVNVLFTGTYTVGFRVATTQATTQFLIKLGNTVLATVNIPSTGGWDNWNTVIVNNVSLTAGQQTLRIQSTNNDNCDFNWMEYTLATGSTAPTANAGLSQIIQLPTNQTTVTGTGTSGNGSTLTYGWTRVSGPNNSPDLTIVSPTSSTTNITGLMQGTYVFRLTVTQSDNQTATSDVTVTVNPAVSTVPTANAGLSQIIQLPTSQTTLTGTGTSGNGSTLSYGWTRVSGPNNAPNLTIVSPTTATTNITGLIQGTYVFRLTVTQSDNQTATSDVTITVNPVIVSDGKTIPGKIEAEAWDTKSGYQYSIPTTDVGGGLKMVGISNGSWLDYNVNVLFTGTYTVGFRVATTQATTQFLIKLGNTVLATVNIPSTGGWDNWNTVIVNNVSLTAGQQTLRIQSTNNDNCDFNWMEYTLATGSTTPTANAGLSQIIQLPTSQTTLIGSGTSGNGSTLSYGWTRVSGPNNTPNLTIVSPSSATTNVTGLIQGTYVFRLTVTQSDNQTATSDVTVTVNPASDGKTIPGKIEAEAWDTKSGYQYSLPTTDVGGGLKMVGISNGSWLDYNVNVLQSGIYTVGFRVATTQALTQFQIKLGSTVLATVNIPSTGGWDNWNTVIVNNVALTAGLQTLRILSTNNENCDFNWMEYSFVSAAQNSSNSLFVAPKAITKEKELETANRLTIKVFPNPASSYFNLKVNSSNNGLLEIKVYDVFGRTILQTKGTKDQTFRMGDHFINGTYLIEVRQGTEKIATKVVKQ